MGPATGIAVAKKIRDARRRKGMSQREAAFACGLPVDAYGDVETGEREVAGQLGLRDLRALCACLDLDLYGLFRLPRPVRSPSGRLSALIRGRRAVLRLSEDRLGAQAGVSGEAIRALEAGDAAILERWALHDVVALARALGLPPAALIDVAAPGV